QLQPAGDLRRRQAGVLAQQRQQLLIGGREFHGGGSGSSLRRNYAPIRSIHTFQTTIYFRRIEGLRAREGVRRRPAAPCRSCGASPIFTHDAHAMSVIDKLSPLRAHSGARRTPGLDDATIERFAAGHPDLVQAIDAAAEAYAQVRANHAELLDLDEDAQVEKVQAGFVNFCPQDGVNPYVALTARGAWIVTLKGAVLYDTGGYGMLGFGHAPQAVIDAMARPQAMANIMTPSLSQM